MSGSAPDVDPALANASATLASFISDLTLDDVPGEVVDHVRYLILDALGCCLQGAMLPWTRHVADMVLTEGGNPQTRLITSGEAVTMSQAVLVNATAGHAFEMDDIHRDSIIHGGSIVTPIALAIADGAGPVSGRRFLESVIAGYETGTRVGSAASQSLLLKGFHPQGTTGTIAGGATAAKALGLDATKTLHALGTAASQAAGLMAAQEGAMVKRFHSGRAAQSGLYGALLARAGFTGITDFVEAPYGGFLAAYSDDVRPERVLQGLGSHWETAAVGYKPFAAVTSIHTALEALRSIMDETGMGWRDVRRVEAHISEPTYLHCAWPYTGQSVTAAQMNLYYGLAVMAIDGAAFVDQYTQARLDDPDVMEFIERVHAYSDPEINRRGPAARHTARITVEGTDGSRAERTVENRKGSPDNPLSEDEVLDKFRSNAASALDAPVAESLIDAVLNIDQLDDVSVLWNHLVTTRPVA